MKKFIKYTGIAFLAASFLTACTGAFEDMNTDPKGVTDEELKQDGNYIGAHFVPMMKSVYYNTSGGNWEFQLTQNLHADMFSGYMSSINPFNGNVNNMTYSMNAGWNDYCWDYAYNTVMSECLKAQKKCAEDPDTYAHFYAISTISACLPCRVRPTNTVASSILNMASRPPEVNTMLVMWSIRLSLRN